MKHVDAWDVFLAHVVSEEWYRQQDSDKSFSCRYCNGEILANDGGTWDEHHTPECVVIAVREKSSE